MDATGQPLPDDTLAACKEADAIILGAVGGPKWSDPNSTVRPEQGLLQLRQGDMDGLVAAVLELPPQAPDQDESAQGGEPEEPLPEHRTHKRAFLSRQR